MADLQLRVGGQAYGGWLSVSVQRSIEQVASSFELSVSERWHGQDQPMAIREGQSCTVACDGHLAITGFIDETSIAYAVDTHDVRVSGRSRAGDLVDCAAEHEGGQWRSQGLLQIVTDIANPLAIFVTTDVDLGAPITKFALQDGESAWEAIERAARMRGVLVISDAQGNIRLTRAGSRRTATTLQRGVNILRGERRDSMRERFSVYRVKAQTSGTNEWNGTNASEPMAVEADSGVTRRRPLVVHAETQADREQLTKRALWERNTRAGKAHRASYTVAGWTPNTRVRVVDDMLRIDEVLLIVSARFSYGPQGSTTTLELTRPEAFDVLALPESVDGSLFR